MLKKRLLLTCEHASYFIPKPLRPLIQGPQGVLVSHRGSDLGALGYARAVAELCAAPLFYGKVSRLVIDLNRSLHHRKLFSEYTHSLPRQKKQECIRKYWTPFREQVRAYIEAASLKNEQVCHLSCHTFTPTLHGIFRSCDIGILYDPRRVEEKSAAHELYKRLIRETSLKIRMNYPYLGRSDGHTTALRRLFRSGEYIGIELEVNQALIGTDYWKYVGFPALARAIRNM